MKEIKEDLDTLRDMLWPWLGRANIVNVLILPKLLYRFNMISVKSPAKMVCGHRQIILKCIWKGNGSRLAQTILKKKRNKMGRLSLLGFKIYCLGTVIKTVILGMDRHIAQEKRA